MGALKATLSVAILAQVWLSVGPRSLDQPSSDRVAFSAPMIPVLLVTNLAPALAASEALAERDAGEHTALVALKAFWASREQAAEEGRQGVGPESMEARKRQQGPHWLGSLVRLGERGRPEGARAGA